MSMEDETRREIAQKNEIIRVLNGSRLYGLHHEDSDYDALAVFIEPPAFIFSKRKIDSTPLHDRGPEEKAQPGEIDGQAYSLRHFIELITTGNPTASAILFAPEDAILVQTKIGKQLFENKDLFLSKQAAPRFEGYFQNQVDRFIGIKTGHIPNRPEIVEKYGYDTKYALNLLRLAIQGFEYFTAGKINLPMLPGNISFLKDVRFGKYHFDEVVEFMLTAQAALHKASEMSDLPDHPDYDKIYNLSRLLHQQWWNQWEDS